MYSSPSASHRRAPSARSTMMGSPPTARNARTGLFTPPTNTSVARRKISCEWGRSFLPAIGALIYFCAGNRDSALLQPAGRILRVIGENNACACPVNPGEDFERDALLVNPAVGGGCLHHRKFAADVIGADGHVESFADAMDDVEIRERGRHHNHVRAPGKVQLNFA